MKITMDERARTLLGELEAKLAKEDGEEPEEEAEVTTAGTDSPE